MTTIAKTTMGGSPILLGKPAIIFGAEGSFGAAIAKELAAEGAHIFLAGRTKSSLEAVAKRITATGREAHIAVLDALADAAVNSYVDSIVKQTGKIDIILDVTGPLAREYGNSKNA